MSLESRYVLISPCRNEAAFMRQTIETVLAQTLRPTEWIIVDDGSTDGTWDFLCSIHDSRIRILRQDNRGITYTLNRMLGEIHTPWLMRLDGGQVLSEGLLTRMFAASTPCEPMYAAIASLHAAGLPTCLLSNSWGSDGYPREVFGSMYHAVVISGEVGMRKPEERIFEHAAGLIGLAPGECVFIDDMEANVQAAEAMGMRGVLHTEPEATVQALGKLFGMSLG